MKYSVIFGFGVILLTLSTAMGQGSHLGNLINVYKEQNSGGTNPSSSRKPPSPELLQAVQPVPIDVGVPPRANLIRDPHAAPDDLLNQPPQGEILLASRQYSGPPQPVPPMIGNPRDPLNGDFVPYLKPPTERSVTPYDEMLYDARLNDVCFIDAKRGWAVGDRGAIWFTEDGGAKWTLQETPIDCTLWSVSFLDGAFGLAVGGYSFPFTSKGRGVVLGTRDGGKSWTVLYTPDFPVLHHVKIYDALKIILAGESSESYPTGLFLSTDGGRNWKPPSGGKNGEGKTDGWISIGMFDEKTGFGVDRRSVNRIFHDRTTVSQTPGFGTARPTGVKIVTQADPPGKINGWMVGSSGLVLSTLDRGARWGAVPGTLPGSAAGMVDLETIEAQGSKLWVAGSPGTHIYTSGDLGKTWKAVPSGVSSAIRKIVFIDEKTGWAVGDLGAVQKTEDGGNTWKTQRQGGKRLAVLGVFARAEEIPFEAFASLCAHQGYLGGAVLVFRDENDEQRPMEAPWTHRVHEAMLRTGGVGLWQLGPFRLDRSGLPPDYNRLVERIQKESDGKGMGRLRERLVAAIRQWKPDVLLTAEVGTKKDPARELVLREVMEAVKMADDAKAFPQQITELGLETWKVKKVHVALEDGKPGDVNLATTEPLIRLGQSVDETAFASRGLLETAGVPQMRTGPAILGFLTPYDQMEKTGSKDFFAGLQIVPGSEARRSLTGSFADHWEEIRNRIQQRRHTLGIIRKVGQVAEENGRRPSDVRLASNAAELARKIDRDAAVRMLLEIGQKYHHEGDWESACEAYEIIARQYSHHPLARQSFLWLLRYQGGEEPGWRKHHLNRTSEIRTAFNGNRLVGHSAFGAASMNRHKIDPRLDKAAALGEYMEKNFPDLFAEAPMRFTAASVQRRKGNLAEAVKFYRSRGRLEHDDVWGMRARTELWLALDDKSELPKEQQELPMPAMICTYTGTKPWLDGVFDRKLDSNVWFTSRLYPLTSEKPRKRLGEMLNGQPTGNLGVTREDQARAESKKFGTQVMFMYDQEYLYIGIRCPRAAGFSYPPFAEKPRARDLPIDDQDRVEILLDVDRDYATAYSLTIDSRGWVVDACWGDKTWNPEFRVARHEDKQSWYIEAALSLDSLTDMPPGPGAVWAVGVRRIVPGIGIECWNVENSFDLTEGFGPLLFE